MLVYTTDNHTFVNTVEHLYFYKIPPKSYATMKRLERSKYFDRDLIFDTSLEKLDSFVFWRTPKVAHLNIGGFIHNSRIKLAKDGVALEGVVGPPRGKDWKEIGPEKKRDLHKEHKIRAVNKTKKTIFVGIFYEDAEAKKIRAVDGKFKMYVIPRNQFAEIERPKLHEKYDQVVVYSTEKPQVAADDCETLATPRSLKWLKLLAKNKRFTFGEETQEPTQKAVITFDLAESCKVRKKGRGTAKTGKAWKLEERAKQFAREAQRKAAHVR